MTSTDLIKQPSGYFQHESAIVDSGAQIGRDTRIWHWVHVCSGAEIGAESSLGQGVFVGNRCKVQNNVSLYDGVVLEDDVFCGPSMVFTNVVNPRSQFVRKEELKTTLVKRGASLGANCTIVCGVILGEFSFAAAGAVVTANVKPYSLVAGVPAKQIGWMSRFGERIPLPLAGQGQWTCPHTGDRYVLSEGDLHCALVREE